MTVSYSRPNGECPSHFQALEEIAGLRDDLKPWHHIPEFRQTQRDLAVYGLTELRIVKEPWGYGYVLTPNGKSLMSLITGFQFPLRPVGKRARGKEWNGTKYATIAYDKGICNALLDLANRGYDYERAEVIEHRTPALGDKITVYAIFPPSELIENVSAILRVTFDEHYESADAGYVVANNNLTTMAIWHCLRTFTNVVASEKREVPNG